MFCPRSGLRSHAYHAAIWYANIKEIFQELIEGMIRVTDDQDLLSSVIVESLCEQGTNEGLSGT